jgi:O-antigen ligase
LIISSGIFLTLSRTGILLAAILLTFYFFQNNFFRKLPILLLISIILLGFTYYWSVNDPTSFESIFIDRVDVNGGNGRFDIWVQKVDFFTKNASNPIGYYSSLYVFDGVSAHNFFLTTLIEQSILGLLSLMFLFYPFFRKKAFLGQNRILIFGLLLCLANLFFEDANSNQQYIFTFWLYMTIVYTVMQGNSTQKVNITTTFRMV